MRTLRTPDWKKLVTPYAAPSTARSLWQVASTLVGLVACEVAANSFLGRSIPLAVLFVLLSGGFLVRVFILQHDCGHGSFLKDRRLADAIGTFFGVLMMTPYEAWRRDHAMHHATTGDLERRGTGDIPMMTVQEYADASPLARFGYRLLRNPFVMFGLGPTSLFLFAQRVPRLFGKDRDRRVTSSVHFTNVAGALFFGVIVLLGGWQALLLVHLPAAIVACSAGVFLFYVQHQFERPSWARHDTWDFATASLDGSSYLKLPALLRYFSGDIGVHHIHHLAPQVPNYRLRECMDANPELRASTELDLVGALKTTALKLYDEETGTMVGFAQADALVAARKALGTDDRAQSAGVSLPRAA